MPGAREGVGSVEICRNKEDGADADYYCVGNMERVNARKRIGFAWGNIWGEARFAGRGDGKGGGGLLPVAYSGPWGGSPGSPDSQQRGGRSQGGAKVLAAWEGTTTAAVTAGAGARWGLEMENVDSLAGVQSHRVRPCH